jgi:hypothetical protein
MNEFRSPGLSDFLGRELAAGNAIVERGKWGDLDMIFLELPFRTPPPDASTGLIFRDVDDPHYWLAEVYSSATKEVLACRYAPGLTSTRPAT